MKCQQNLVLAPRGERSPAGKQRELSHEYIEPAMTVERVQKSSVVPPRGSKASSTRTGQSAVLMWQNKHSETRGTRIGGVSAASRRMRSTRF